MRVYIINGRVTRKKLDDISQRGYFMGYATATGFIVYYKPDQPFVSTEPIVFGLMNIILISSQKTNILHVLYYFHKILKVMFIIYTSST